MKLGRNNHRSLLAWPTAVSVAAGLAVSVSSCSKLMSMWKGGASTESTGTTQSQTSAQTPTSGNTITLPPGANITQNPDGSFTATFTQLDGTTATQNFPAGTVFNGMAQGTPGTAAPGTATTTPGVATGTTTGAAPVTKTGTTTAPTTATAPSTSTTTPGAATAVPGATAPTTAATAPKTAAPVAAAPAPAPAPAPKPAAPEKLCYKLTFHHKPAPGHSDRESCSAHKNFIKLTQDDVNPKSICLRVDNVPVKYQVVKTKKTKKMIGLMIEPVAGPNSVITANFCTGKKMCKEDCRIPKDSFMDAIGGEDNNAKTENVQIVQWDPTEKGTDKDVSAQLEAELKKELAGTSGLKVFEDWVNDDQSLSCGSKSHAFLDLNGKDTSLVTATRR